LGKAGVLVELTPGNESLNDKMNLAGCPSREYASEIE
jgi:hypothetical protein